MAKTRAQRLRGINRRRQTAKKLGKFLFGIAVIIAIIAAAGYGAWQLPQVKSIVKGVMQSGRAGSYPLSPDYRQVGLGESFDFAGGTLTIDSVHTAKAVQSVFGGGVGNEPPEIFKPKRGTWLLVLVTFRGSSNAETGTLDPDSIKLVDEDGHVYDNRTGGSPAEDLAVETSTTRFTEVRLTDPVPRQTILIFDVSPNVQGLRLVFLRQEEGQMKVIRAAKVTMKNAPAK